MIEDENTGKSKKTRRYVVASIVMLAVVYSAGALFVVVNQYDEHRKAVKRNLQKSVEVDIDDNAEIVLEEVDQIELVLSNIDISSWKTFQNKWYGFELKYPEAWMSPTNQGATRGSKWEYRYKFRKQLLTDDEMFIGFDVVVYNTKKIKDIFDTEEFSLLENEEFGENSECQNARSDLVESWGYRAEKIHISANDKCYHPTMFFSLARDGYILNFVVKTKDGNQEIKDPSQKISDNLPQFFPSASTLKLIDIKRPPPKPKITAPKPVQFKIENGRMVCSKKNDKPKKSKKTKHKHLDMECCLDPDEYPNPWCYYDPEKYGKYL